MSNQSPLERQIHQKTTELDASRTERREQLARHAAAVAQIEATAQARTEALRPVQRAIAGTIRSDAHTVASLLADKGIHPGTEVWTHNRQYYRKGFPSYRLVPKPVDWDDSHVWVLKATQTMTARPDNVKESSVVIRSYGNEGVAISSHGTLHYFRDTPNSYGHAGRVVAPLNFTTQPMSDDELVPLDTIDLTLDAEKTQQTLAEWRGLFVDLAAQQISESDPN